MLKRHYKIVLLIGQSVHARNCGTMAPFYWEQQRFVWRAEKSSWTRAADFPCYGWGIPTS